MVTKADLMFVRTYVQRRRIVEDQLETLRERVDVHSVQYDKILAHGGEERDRMAEHAARVDEVERELGDLIREYTERYIAITKEIVKLPPEEADVIRYRYQDAHSWRWIRRRMHYSEAGIFKLHGRALAHLEEL